jgi:hypothetical protein
MRNQFAKTGLTAGNESLKEEPTGWTREIRMALAGEMSDSKDERGEMKGGRIVPK